MNQAHASVMAWSFLVSGLLLLLVHFFLQVIGRYRGYVIFLGLAAIFHGVSDFMRPDVAWLPDALAGAMVVWAGIEAVRETRERIAELRLKQQEREAAFADLMREMATLPQEETTPPPPKPPKADADF